MKRSTIHTRQVYALSATNEVGTVVGTGEPSTVVNSTISVTGTCSRRDMAPLVLVPRTS